jgi:hypothetical protein
VALVLIGSVTDFAESFEEYGAAERILLLALVEVDMIFVTELTRWGPLGQVRRAVLTVL